VAHSFQAPTGFYTLTLHVDDRIDHIPGVTRKVRGFVVYKKAVRISRITLDKACTTWVSLFVAGGHRKFVGYRPEGSARRVLQRHYPWISLSSQGGRNNPDLAVSTLHEDVNISSGTAVAFP